MSLRHHENLDRLPVRARHLDVGAVALENNGAVEAHGRLLSSGSGPCSYRVTWD